MHKCYENDIKKSHRIFWGWLWPLEVTYIFPTLLCAVFSHSVASNSLQSHWLYSPSGSSVHGDSPGKNTIVICHALLQGILPTPLCYLYIILFVSPWENDYSYFSVAQLCPTLCNSMDCSPSAPLSMRFPRQEYWSGFPCSPPGDLPDPEIKPMSSALAGGFFTTGPPGKPRKKVRNLFDNMYRHVVGF